MESLPLTGPLPPRPRGVDILAVHMAFLVLTTIAFALRIWSKQLIRAPYHLEDWFVTAALIIFYGYTACSIIGILLGGIGYHLKELSPNEWRLEVILKTSLANQFTYATGLGLVKVSVCLLLARIFHVRRFKILSWVAMGCCVAWAVMTILIGFLICTPLAYNWDHRIKYGHCGNQHIAYAFVGVIDILTDLFIILLPQHMIWKLHLPLANRVALGFLFALGSLTIALSILRVVVIFNIDFLDFPFSIRDTEIYTIAEFGTAIMISCGPLVRPVFEKVFKNTSTRFRYATDPATKGRSIQGSNAGRGTSHVGFSVLDDGEIPLKKIPGPMGTEFPRVTTKIISYSKEAQDMDFGFRQNPKESNRIVVKTQTSTISEV